MAAYITVILGWLLVISGIILLLKPEKARKKLLRKGFRIIKGLLAVAAVYLIMLSISFARKTGGGIFLILGLIAALAVIVIFFKLKKKTYERLEAQFEKIPVIFLRGYAGIQIIIGILMITLKHRIM